MIGLVGSHRVGKTTLALAFAKEQSLPFVQTDTVRVFQALGRDPKADYPLDERLAIQTAILEAVEMQYRHAQITRGPLFITDRTPIDMAGYLLAEVSRTTLVDSPALAALVQSYVARCIEVSNTYFESLVLVQPGIPFAETPGKAPSCPAYMDHLNATMKGLMMDERHASRRVIVPVDCLKLEARVQALRDHVSGILAKRIDMVATHFTDVALLH